MDVRSVLLSLMVCLMETNLNIIENWEFGFSSPYACLVGWSKLFLLLDIVGYGVTFTFLPFRVQANL